MLWTGQSEEAVLTWEHDQVKTHIDNVMETNNECHELFCFVQFSCMVISYELCEGPVVDWVCACNARVYLNVCVDYD